MYLDSDDGLLVALSDQLWLVAGLAATDIVVADVLLVLGDGNEYLLLVLAVTAVGFQTLFGVMPLVDDAPIEVEALPADFEVLAVADLDGYDDEPLPAVVAEPCSQALFALAAEPADADGLLG